MDAFLDDASRFGICSGVSFAFHDVSHHGALVVLNSARPIIDQARRKLIELALPNIVRYGRCFLSWFSASVMRTTHRHSYTRQPFHLSNLRLSATSPTI